MKPLQKSIQILFGLLFFITPLILWPFTSELFEFNKMVFVYLITVLIVGAWIIRMISAKKWIFSRTMLDIPLLAFLGGQIISTIISIDSQTSLLGYYSRFNGGLFSTISYLLLYWSFVSNIGKDQAKKLLRLSLVSGIFVAFYGVLEKLGIDKNVWQQDVQNRVFSTLGQPNWLAAWLVALIPLTWSWALTIKGRTVTKSLPILLSVLFIVTLIFTGSRSGLLGFGVIGVVFWSVIFIKNKLIYFKEFLIINSIIVVIVAIFGTQLTPSIFKLIGQKTTNEVSNDESQLGATSLETGGTESGTIRKIVWQGAIDVWKHYPIFGTGVETFAYSYYMYRPVEHNTTSEWDYIYNKAHNEYLNFLANSGMVGLLTYLISITFTLYLFYKVIRDKNLIEEKDSQLTTIAFASGYISILVTNFFGFSVVPIQILFYLFPAFAIAIADQNNKEEIKEERILPNQKPLIYAVLLGVTYLIFIICRYWYADILYAKGVNYDRINRYDISPEILGKAINLEPSQSVYYSELAKAYTNLSLAYNSAKEATAATELANAAISSSLKAVDLSPANINMKRMQFGVYVMLSSMRPEYLNNAKDVLISTVAKAPTDAKIRYNLGLIYSRIGQNDLALDTLKTTVDLKPDYKDARLAYAILLINAKRNDEARSQLEYILKNIDPTDSISKQYLEGIQ